MRYVGSEYDNIDDDDDDYEDDDELDEEGEEGGGRPPSRLNPFTPSSGGQRSSTLPGAGRSSVTGGSSLSSRLPPSPSNPNRPASPSSSSSSPPRYGGTTGSGYSGSSSPSSPTRPPVGGSSSQSSSTSPFSSRYPATPTPPPGGSSSGSTYPPRSPSSSPSSSSSGSYGGSSPSRSSPTPTNKDQKSGGLMGGLSGRLGRGGSDKPAPPKSSGGKPASGGGLSSFTSRLTNRGDAPAKPASTGRPASGSKSAGGGFLSRLRPGGDKKDDKRATGTTLPFKPGGTSPSSTSPYGGTRPSTTTGSASAVRSTSEVKRPMFGSASSGVSSSSKSSSARAEAQAGGLRRFLPFGGGAKEDKKPDKKARPSKAPQIQGEGLSLDNKLDILGVALVLGSLMLFLSRLSSTRGQLTEWVNGLLTQTFGWGAIAIPIAMMAIGIWLIARHFGDEAPVVPSTRIFGIVLLYVGVLVLMQYIDTYSYVNKDGSLVTIDALQTVWLPISIARGSGGGWVGANLYFLLASNFTEYGAFLSAVFLLVVGTMFILSISAAELAMIVISVGRSFGDARQRRAQRRAQTAAPDLEQLTAEAASPAISVSKPEPEVLPAPTAPALPAASEHALPAGTPASAPQRNIAIKIGGRSLSPFGGSGNLQPVENKGGKTAAGTSAAPASGDKSPAPAGGFGSRLRGALPSVSLPGAKPATAEAAASKPAAEMKPATPEKSASPMGTLRGMFNRQSSSTDNGTETPAAAAPAKPAAAQPAAQTAPAASRTPPLTASASAAPAGEPAARLGDLLRPAAPPPVRPATPPPPQTAAATADKRASMGAPSPVRASAAPPLVSPAAGEKPPASRLPEAPKPFGSSPSSFRSAASGRPEDLLDDDEDDFEDMDDDFEDQEDDRLANLAPAQPKGTGSLPRPTDNGSRYTSPAPGMSKPADTPANREDRLNAIRSGSISPTPFSRPDDNGTRRDMPQQPAASVQSAASPPPAAPPSARPTIQPFNSAVPVDSPAESEKKPQPVAAFWKPPAESPKAAEAPKTELPKPQVKPPAPSYGKPPTPPGVPVNATTAPNAVPAAANAPLPPSPEIPLRQPGVGTTAPAGARRHKEWKLPSYAALLMPGSEGDIDRESLLRRARIIEDTLNSFGAPGKVVEVNTGPVITQFGVEPDYLVTRGGKKNRVKVGAIAQLDKDLQLALGAKSIRIEAPVPGKGYVGIEVPNDVPSLVSLRDVMESDNFKKIRSPLAIALGQSVDGAPISADLTGMPHLLVAGTTGSGKSVLVNAIITSLLIQNTPDRVKFIMVDPKRVELTGYNGIPHLVAPVVVDLERIVGVLKWVTREMDERYKRFSNAGARNIDDYNAHLPVDAEWMPYIVVIVDELADLMMLAPDETERVITRIAALARATGIHLVIATQRPSVDVVTGLIKANFPARIAFAVASGVDSRVILDQPGAERLLGRGDMLYMSGDSPAPLRLQGVFVSDTEINNITRYWKGQMTDDDMSSKPISTLVLDHSIAESGRSVMPSNQRDEIQRAFWDRDDQRQGSASSVSTTSSNGDNGSADQEDELYEEAVEMVRRLNKASVSLLQRRLRIGYTRAARLIDRMEEEKIVGPAVEGSKPREVLPQIRG
jgi:DNA segregation ATPase FtsK/SpoIIIE-like protein